MDTYRQPRLLAHKRAAKDSVPQRKYKNEPTTAPSKRHTFWCNLLAKLALGVRMSALEWAKLLGLSVSLSALLTAAMGALVWVVAQ